MTRQKDRTVHVFVYILAGAAMGGFLDVFVFDQPSPTVGLAVGSIIGLSYFAVIQVKSRRREDA